MAEWAPLVALAIGYICIEIAARSVKRALVILDDARALNEDTKRRQEEQQERHDHIMSLVAQTTGITVLLRGSRTVATKDVN